LWAMVDLTLTSSSPLPDAITLPPEESRRKKIVRIRRLHLVRQASCRAVHGVQHVQNKVRLRVGDSIWACILTVIPILQTVMASTGSLHAIVRLRGSTAGALWRTWG
jgi:hypothetical protein